MKNKKLQTILVILLLLLPVAAYSGGTTHIISVTVPGLPAPKNATVYLPEGYDPNSTVKYRVVYFLHGVNNSHISPNYNPIYGVFDQLIANDLIEPVILVRPDGSAPPYLGSFYTNSALYGPMEDWIYNYLVSFIDENYKTKADRNNRVIFGHSMGGYGSMKMAFKHPDLYRAAASMAGSLELTVLLGLAPYLIAETRQEEPPYNFSPANGLFSIYAFSLCGAFTPNLSNPPFYVDFLLLPNGNPNWPAFFQAKTHCAARLSNNITAADNLGIYFDCGTVDELGMLPGNIGFKDTLTVRNIPHQFKLFPGADHWGGLFTERIPSAMEFLNKSMNAWDPDYMIDSLISMINGYEMPSGIKSALNDKLYNAKNYLYYDNISAVCSTFNAFLNFIEAQRGKKITTQQADEMIADLFGIQQFINCGGDFIAGDNTEPEKLDLLQNYPNPFNPVTKISFNIPFDQNVKLTVYDIQGRLVRSLVDEYRTAGMHEVIFNADGLSSGTYFYKLESGKFTEVKKMIIIK